MGQIKESRITPAILFGIAFAAFFALGYTLGSAGGLKAEFENKELFVIQDQLPPTEVGNRAVDYMEEQTDSSTAVKLLNISESKFEGFYQVWLSLKNKSNATADVQQSKIYASKDGGYMIGQPINSSEEIKDLLPLN